MLIDDEEKLDILIDKIKNSKKIAVDTETTGLNLYNGDNMIGMSLATSVTESFYVTDFKFIKKICKVLIENKSELILHNAKFDFHVLLKCGINLSENKFCDTMILAWVLNQNEESYGLKQLVLKYFEISSPTLKELLKDFKTKDIREIPIDVFSKYAENDARYTYKLFKFLFPKIKENNLTKIALMEHELVRVLLSSEKYGIKVDVGYINNSIEYYKNMKSVVEKKIYEYVGNEFNILSHKQLSEVMEKLNVKSSLLTKTGYSWNDKALSQMTDVPIAILIRNYRICEKMVSTYFENYLKMKDNNDRIHSNFNQVGTRTGRLSCERPNLQNVPRMVVFDLDLAVIKEYDRSFQFRKTTTTRTSGSHLIRSAIDRVSDGSNGTEYNKIRDCFIPSEGNTLFFIDYEQMELIVFAFLSGDQKLMERMISGEDFHEYVAKQVLNLTEEKGTLEYTIKRQIGKMINFGILYGMGLAGLSAMTNKSIEEVKEFLNSWYALFPGARRFRRKLIKDTEQNGYMINLFGRKWTIPAEEAYKSVNYMVQGTCGDIVKKAMIRIFKYINENNLNSKILSSIHDEIILEVPKNEFVHLNKYVSFSTDFSEFSFPLKVEVKYSDESWGKKKEWIK